MNEEDMMDQIFGSESTRWKGKYPVGWCDLCATAKIGCPVCKNSSCNGGGCKECIDDFVEFCENTKHRVESYLTPEEILVYDKILSLKKHIVDTLKENHREIDWELLNKEGKLSQVDEAMFIDKK